MKHLSEFAAAIARLQADVAALQTDRPAVPKLTARIKAVEGMVTDVKARVEAIEADPQGLTAKTPAKSTSTTKR